MTATPLLDWQPRYPDSPGFKSPGPSQEAAEKVKVKAAVIRAGVLQCLRANPGGLTADECAETMGEHWQNVRPRMSELKADKLIEKTDMRRKNISGCSATVWRVL